MAQGPMAMADPHFPPIGDEQSDDLPRTFRREKEARAREARERAAQERAAAPSLPSSTLSNHASTSASSYAASSSTPAPRVEPAPEYSPAIVDMPYPASVQRFDVPFMHLVFFFLKAVVAAIPALILLTVILWFAGSAVQTLFPELIKMKILISFPN